MSMLSRRGLFKLASGFIGGVLGAAAGLPGLAFLAAPLGRRDEEENPFARLAAMGELSAQKPIRRAVIGSPRDAWMRLEPTELGACFLARKPDGSVLALGATCPHLGCSIDWNDPASHFECPCHKSVFDQTGKRLSGPALRNMDALETKVEGESVLVRFQRFRTGIAGKEPVG